jgi:hypothetical protein
VAVLPIRFGGSSEPLLIGKETLFTSKPISEEPQIGSMFESALFNGLAEDERLKSVFVNDSVPQRAKLFDVAEIETNLRKPSQMEDLNTS